MDWLAVVAAVVAGILLLPSTPTILPEDAPTHENNQVRMAGIVVEQSGKWFTLAAGGTAIRGWNDEPPAVGLSVHVTGRIQADPWTIFVDQWQTEPTEFPLRTMEAVRNTPQDYENSPLALEGEAKGTQLSANGSSLHLSQSLHGDVRVNGVLQYQTNCLCHQLVIHSWTSS